MHAVIETGGKQYRVESGSRIRVERLAMEEGERVEFDRVLLVGDGETTVPGNPCVDGGKVSATVLGHGRAPKVNIIKFKRRKGYLRRQGHRQAYTELRITDIAAG
ncbi:MAG: 50S ribosomal protein L21 [Immundisolibacterales bacterium]|nr:50S ribosomal protein L21 [Immundisolibacterales bacterium]